MQIIPKQKTRANSKLPFTKKKKKSQNSQYYFPNSRQLSIWKNKIGHGKEVSLFINTVHGLKDLEFSKNFSFYFMCQLMTVIINVKQV